jgi:hypothetical protein
MTVRANLYYLQDVPDLSALAATVGTPASGASPPQEGAPGQPMALLVGDVLIELERFSAADLPGHLDALHACLADGYDVRDTGFPARLKEARGAVTVTIDRGRSRAGGEQFLIAMAAGTDALVLDEEGVFRDGAGRIIAAPVDEPGDDEDGGADEEQPADEVPSRDRVAQRALAVATLAWRAFLERDAPVGAAADVAVANAWLEKHGVFGEMSGSEQSLVRAPFGSWSEKQILDCGWCIEAAVVLGWALHLTELPAHDTQTSPAELQRTLGLFAADPAALTAELRPASQIDDQAARLFAIMSRFRELTTSKSALDFAAFARKVCVGGLDLQGISLADGDLAVAGAPISTAPERDVMTAQSIAVERFRAVDWLQGGDLAPAAGAAPPAR